MHSWLRFAIYNFTRASLFLRAKKLSQEANKLTGPPMVRELDRRRGGRRRPRRQRADMAGVVNEAAALTSQRVLGAWEKLRRAVARLLVAEAAAQDLLPRAKLLLVEAMLAGRKATSADP